MSIIVVVRKGAEAVIAADTVQSDEGLIAPAAYVGNSEKILACGDSWLGLAGWSAAQNIMESVLAKHPDDLDFSSRLAIFETACRLHALMKSEYHIDTQEEKDQPVESSQLAMLIANPAGIFELDSYRTVTEYTRFWALGSGRSVALGAMHGLYARLADPADIARAGVEAACDFDDGCALPLSLQRVRLASGGRVVNE